MIDPVKKTLLGHCRYRNQDQYIGDDPIMVMFCGDVNYAGDTEWSLQIGLKTGGK
ncbi:MAG TPA: hypothetical protein PLZ08_09865 [Bacillota bacterium]|nr:hypothetical protein [Bacillota bacterium]HOL10788.1 hypothetical protein [Bacillota bacterium]HPO98244.1 hypothetical protein [Bacillota bacterium]